MHGKRRYVKDDALYRYAGMLRIRTKPNALGVFAYTVSVCERTDCRRRLATGGHIRGNHG